MKELIIQSEQAFPDVASPVRSDASSRAQGTVTPGIAVPLAANHPDAAPRPAETWLRRAIHGLALLAVITFLGYYCLWLPLRERAAFQPELAQAMMWMHPQGGPALLEVAGPLNVIDRLRRRGLVVAEFSTADGPVKIEARPIPGSARVLLRTTSDGQEQQWAVLQCLPADLPDNLRTPGLRGRLR